MTTPRCSARGCASSASWALVWNNPRIHTTDREKVWLACSAHRESLGDFLRLRGFLRRVDPFTGPTEEDQEPSGTV